MKMLLKKNVFRQYSVLDTLEFMARLWVGYVLTSNSGVGTIIPLDSLGIPDPNYSILKAMWDTGFMMHTVKLVELLGGMFLILNFRIPLILIALVPVLLNIYGVHVFMFDSYLTKGLGMLLISTYFLFKYKDRYMPLFRK